MSIQMNAETSTDDYDSDSSDDMLDYEDYDDVSAVGGSSRLNLSKVMGEDVYETLVRSKPRWAD